jgi:hypothetical protein
VTAVFARYADFMASLGQPEQHVMVGPDWWGCLCGNGYLDSYRAHRGEADAHAQRFATTTATVDVSAAVVGSLPWAMGDVHRWLWRQGVLQPVA